ncbi:MAG: hypothetical protein IPK82_31525 [Polyangiaceae bacterium]|nr:hypothetical protein [Polyangiaceae bacterium]
MFSRLHTFLLISSCFLGAIASGCAQPNGSDEADSEDVQSVEQGIAGVLVTPPSAAAATGWMSWAFGQAWSNGPVQDTTGAACANGQSGSIWYLAGTTGGAATRSCTIPAGKTLVFPLINRWAIFRPEAYPDADAIKKLQNDVDNFFRQSHHKTCSLTLTIDGEEVGGDFDALYENQYVLVDDPFNLYVNPGDNIFTPFGVPSGTTGGNMPAEAAGHYAVVSPLPAGDHVLELGGKTCQNKNEVIFETHVTYNLHIDP